MIPRLLSLNALRRGVAQFATALLAVVFGLVSVGTALVNTSERSEEADEAGFGEKVGATLSNESVRRRRINRFHGMPAARQVNRCLEEECGRQRSRRVISGNCQPSHRWHSLPNGLSAPLLS